jgi:hypothetical protein
MAKGQIMRKLQATSTHSHVFINVHVKFSVSVP